MTDNMALWSALEKTDPKYTKPYKGKGGFSGTAINGTSIIKRLTEQFGPCGTGWRFVLETEQIVEGHTLKNGDKAKLHIVRGHIEYRKAEEGAPVYQMDWNSTSPQFGQTMLVDENKNGTFTDEEAPKKSITDCMSKCAVLLGVSADVYLGLYDDNKYVNERRAEEAAKPDQRASLHAPHTFLPQPQTIAGKLGAVEPQPDDVEAARLAYSAVTKAASHATSKRELRGIREHIWVEEIALVKRVNAAGGERLETILAGREAELPEMD